MNTKETLNKVRTLLGIEVKFETMTLENGAVLEAEAFEVGAEIFVVADDERVAVPVGEYLTEDGMAILISEEGIIADIKKVEDAPAEEEAPEEVVEEEMEAEKPSPKKVVESVSTETFFAEIEKLRNEITELKTELSKTELSETFEVKEEVEGIAHNPENKAEKKELNLSSKKSRSTIINRIYNNQINR
jgi:hypothetical protein